MLADKTLLGAALAVTFSAGTFLGYRAGLSRDEAPRPGTVDQVFAPQLREFERRGYDDAEMTAARQHYKAYLEGYDRWWREFLESHSSVLDPIDDALETNLEELEASFAKRTAATGGPR